MHRFDATSKNSHSLNEAPEDLPRRQPNSAALGVVPADANESDEAAFPHSGDRKCGGEQMRVQLRRVLPVVDRSPSNL
jgi:hypothetical protein